MAFGARKLLQTRPLGVLGHPLVSLAPSGPTKQSQVDLHLEKIRW